MKTAISIPDSEFKAAEKVAARLSLNRSELYRTALTEFLAKHQDDGVTEKLDEIYGGERMRVGLDNSLQWMQVQSLPQNEKW